MAVWRETWSLRSSWVGATLPFCSWRGNDWVIVFRGREWGRDAGKLMSKCGAFWGSGGGIRVEAGGGEKARFAIAGMLLLVAWQCRDRLILKLFDSVNRGGSQGHDRRLDRK